MIVSETHFETIDFVKPTHPLTLPFVHLWVAGVYLGKYLVYHRVDTQRQTTIHRVTN